MLTVNDELLLLYDLEKQGIDTTEITKKALSKNKVDFEVIKFINDNRQLDLTAFYEKIRKSYNHKKSTIYINIVKETEDIDKVLSTLSALLTQIILFSAKANNKIMFLRHARAEEISKVLTLYFKNYDIKNCINILKLIKADIKACEFIK